MKNFKGKKVGHILVGILMILALTACGKEEKEVAETKVSAEVSTPMGDISASENVAAEMKAFLYYVGGMGEDVYSYQGEGYKKNTEGITAVETTVKEGDTITLELTLPCIQEYAYRVAPVLVAENVMSLDFSIDSIRIDGADVTESLNMSACEEKWWYDSVGKYEENQAVFLAGGLYQYDNWGLEYVPAHFKTIEYTITFREITTGKRVVNEEAPTDISVFLAYEGDAKTKDDRGNAYHGEKGESLGNIVPTNAVINEGDTVTVGVELPEEAVYTWNMAPVLVVEDVVSLDYTIESVKLDGVDITDAIDWNKTHAKWWYEELGDYGKKETVHLAGGFSEWAEYGMCESPCGFKKIEYTITLHDIVTSKLIADDSIAFEDIPFGAYYEEPVRWAVDNGVTNGYGSSTTFCPELVCTRGQIVTFLWRAKGCPEPASLNNPFTDVAGDAYYYKAVLWAVEQGITNGYGSDTIFNPDGECTRGQVATFMWRAEGEPTNSGNNPFSDLNAGAYYYDAVLWAAENGVTNGYGGTNTFCPDIACTRGQIVTFLYRGMN